MKPIRRWFFVALLLAALPRLAAGGDDSIVRYTLAGEQGVVSSVDISADGSKAVSGSDDGLLCLWDLSTGKCTRTITAHTRPVYAVQMTADGKRVASISNGEGRLCVWDATTGKLISLTKQDWRSFGVAISDNGKFAAVGAQDGQITVVDVDHDKPLGSIGFKDAIPYALALSPDGKTLATATRQVLPNDNNTFGFGDGSITLFDVASGKQLKQVDTVHRPELIKFSRDGKQLHFLGWEDSWGALDGATLEPINVHHWQETEGRNAALTEDNASLILAGHFNDLEVVLPSDKMQQHQKLPGCESLNQASAVSSDGKIALVGGSAPLAGGRLGSNRRAIGCVKVIDLTAKPKVYDTFESVSDLRLSADGNVVTIRGRNTQNTEFRNLATKDMAVNVGMMSHGPDLPTAYINSSLSKIVTIDRKQLEIFYEPRRKATIVKASYDRAVTMAVSPDENWIVFGRGLGDEIGLKARPGAIQQDLQLFDFQQDKRLPDLATGGSPVAAIAFSPDSKLMAATFSGLQDPNAEQSLQVWDMATQKQLLKLPLHDCYQQVAVSRGNRIAAAVGHTIELWEWPDGKSLTPIQTSAKVDSLCFAADGRHLLAGHAGGKVDLIDSDSGEVEKVIDIGGVSRERLQVQADGSVVAIAFDFSDNGSIRPIPLPAAVTTAPSTRP